MIGIAFSTAALIIVLSVFNGLGDLLRSLNSSFDPEIKIELEKGKSFEVSPEFLAQIQAIEGVQIVTEVIEDYAYVRYRDADMVIILKGVSNNFLDQHRFDDHIADGRLVLEEKGINYAIIGRGVQYALSVAAGENLYPLQLFYIKNMKASGMDPSQLYTRKSIEPGGVFSIEKNYDENYIFVPLQFAQELLNYENKRTSLEIQTDMGVNEKDIQQKIKTVVGDKFKVLTNEEQHQDIYRLIKIEKLFTAVALMLLVLVASINIFFSLMMLAIDKKKDISILFAMGAQQRLIQKIFLGEGSLIAFSGAITGLVIGGVICWLQNRFGWVGIGMDNAIVSSYPVEMKLSDFVLTSAVIIAITILVSFYPARLAARSYSIDHL